MIDNNVMETSRKDTSGNNVEWAKLRREDLVLDEIAQRLCSVYFSSHMLQYAKGYHESQVRSSQRWPRQIRVRDREQARRHSETKATCSFRDLGFSGKRNQSLESRPPHSKARPDIQKTDPMTSQPSQWGSASSIVFSALIKPTFAQKFGERGVTGRNGRLYLQMSLIVQNMLHRATHVPYAPAQPNASSVPHIHRIHARIAGS